MKTKRIIYSALCVFLLLLFASCNANVSESAVIPSLTVTAVDETPKALIGYDGSGATGSATDITHYTIAMNAEDGSVVVPGDTYYAASNPSFTVNDVMTGTYTFTVSGYIAMADGDYHKIAESSISKTLRPSDTDVSVVLDDFVAGNASSFSVSLEFPTDFASSNGAYSGSVDWEIREGIGLDGTVVLEGTDAYTWTDTAPTGTLTLDSSELSSLTPGRYTLIATITDTASGNTGLTKTTVEGIRVLPGLPVTGSVSFVSTSPMDGNVTVVDRFGDIIELTGTEGVIDVDDSGTVQVTVNGIPSGAKGYWYLNGEPITPSVSGNVYTIPGIPGGKSIIEAIFTDDTASGIGYIAFETNRLIIEIEQAEPKLPTPNIGSEPPVVGGNYVKLYNTNDYVRLPNYTNIDFYWGRSSDNLSNIIDGETLFNNGNDLFVLLETGSYYIQARCAGYLDSDVAEYTIRFFEPGGTTIQ